MPLRRAVALWRTSAALGLALLTATACGQTAGSHGSTTVDNPSTRAVITAAGQSPLVVEGAGFRPYEKVQLTAKTLVRSACSRGPAPTAPSRRPSAA